MKIHMADNFCTIYKLRFHQLAIWLQANGHSLVDTPGEADILIGGVCAAFEADEARSVALARALKPAGAQDTCLIGCMTAVNPSRLPRFGVSYKSWEYHELAAAIDPLAEVPFDAIPMPATFRRTADYRSPNAGVRHVGISEGGCSFRCTYCPHVVGAGPQVSRPRSDVVNQIRSLIEQNVDTIILTALDTASYGRDVGTSFAELLEDILSLQANWDRPRYHVAQFNSHRPERIKDAADRERLIECCFDPRIVDFQLPIQTTSARLLGLMHRDYSADMVDDFIRAVGARNRRIRWRTDLLVGFPTETQSEWAASVEFAARHFNEIAVYAYEHKPGTPIYDAGLRQIDPQDIRVRQHEAIGYLRERGRIVHSSGQDIASLRVADSAKARKESNGDAARGKPERE